MRTYLLIITSALLASVSCTGDNTGYLPPLPVTPAPTDKDGGDSSIADSGSGDAATAQDGSAADAACKPMVVSCGFCGTVTGTCIDGHLVWGTCMGEGVCAPGTTSTTPDGCASRTCTVYCRWPAWELKSGNMCYTGTTNSCYASGCSHNGTQTCVACKWGTCYCN